MGIGQRRGRRAALMAAVALAAVFALAACGARGGGGGGGGATLTIGSANFTESELIARMYAHALQNAGHKTTVKAQIGSREVYIKSLQNNEIQIVPEYVGTVTEYFNAQINGPNAPTSAPLATPDAAATDQALNTLIGSLGLTATDPSPAADQNAFAVTADFASKNGLASLADLVKLNGTLVLGGPPECPTRPFCQPGLEQAYGLRFAAFKPTDSGGPVTFGALADGTIQLGLVFSSDGSVVADNLKILTDDKHLQQADNIVGLMRQSVPADAQAVINRVNAALTTADLQQLNMQMTVNKDEPDALAAQWVKDHIKN
ncbi:MAG: ABC transporter substrate-binding protein [Frankiaceae bacterium]|jgi:osmoprotectant transport system substrate-binding protein|nr:ABC transporter substrate-binding protein [Frankiaceae bacterium]